MKIKAIFNVWDETLTKREVARRIEDLLPPHGINLLGVKISRPTPRRLARVKTSKDS